MHRPFQETILCLGLHSVGIPQMETIYFAGILQMEAEVDFQ